MYFKLMGAFSISLGGMFKAGNSPVLVTHTRHNMRKAPF